MYSLVVALGMDAGFVPILPGDFFWERAKWSGRVGISKINGKLGIVVYL